MIMTTGYAGPALGLGGRGPGPAVPSPDQEPTLEQQLDQASSRGCDAREASKGAVPSSH